MKGQTSIEYLLVISVVGVIVIVALSYLYLTYSKTITNFPTINEYISSFSINSFGKSSTSPSLCGFNFSFSSQANIISLPIYLKLNSPTGKFYFLDINSSDYTATSYYQTSGNYHYDYLYTTPIFNSTVCNLFNNYNNGNIGDISEVIGNYNGKTYAFKLYSPDETIYP